MSDPNPVRDGFESYYTEKLWQLVPEVYRNEDGLAANPGVLRRIVELIGAEAARTRRSIDRLWEDQFVETCDDWAVPYIGDLVGARLVSANDRRARRVDVANAVKFRRRRGTPDLLDHLVRSLSGWDVVLVEGFRRLARTRHRLDPVPRAGGFFTGTLTGGTADLRSPAGAELGDGPFGEYFHTLDARLLRGRDGRFGPTKLNFHLYRLRAFEMLGVDPVELTDPNAEGFPRLFTFDPSGRDLPLFIDADPPDPDAVAALPGQLSRPTCGQPLEWEVTQAMRCRLLGHEAFEVTPSHVEEVLQLANPPTAADEAALLRVLEVRFNSEQALRRRLRDLGAAIAVNPPDWYRALVGLSLLERTGKANLYPAQVQIAPFTAAEVAAANLAARECQPDPENNLAALLIYPEQGRFASVPENRPNFDPLVTLYHYGFSGEVGAGPYPRDPVPAEDVPTLVASGGAVPGGGVLQGDGLLFDDNRTYTLTIESATPVDNAVLMAGSETLGLGRSQRRPYVMLSGGGANLQPQATDSTFLIDGGWYGVNDPSSPPAAGAVADFVIEGAAGADPEEFDFDRVEIRFATLDPGGVRADGVRIPALRLLVRARIRTLVIRRSIVGPVHVVRDDPDDPSLVEELLICESIVDARETLDRLAVSSNFGTVVIEGSTIFGDVAADVLKASDSIVDGRVRVVNNQAGCFRFSASEPGPGVRLPPRYHDLLAPIPESAFNSTRFGDPQYAQLSVVAPQQLLNGAENSSEMGVFSHLLAPIRMSSVRAKVNEYGPVGMLAQYLFEGDYRAQSLVEFGVLNPEPEEVPPPPPPDPGEVIPEPPPPEPEPLPTTCPDDEEPTLTVPVDEPRVNELTIIDINGAPDFWRGVDWREDAFPAPQSEDRQLQGIPFDKVRVLLEYDARFGTLPAEQGWRANSDEAAARYSLDDRGGLQFKLDDQPALFTAQAVLAEKSPSQIHAYAVAFLDNIPSASESPFHGFELRVGAEAAKGPVRGMRADWLRVREGRESRDFHYVSFFNDIILSPEPTVSRRWHEVSLQACFADDINGGGMSGCVPNILRRRGEVRDPNPRDDAPDIITRGDDRGGQAILSIDGTLDEMRLSKFGEWPDEQEQERPSLRALFGVRGKTEPAAGRLRNFVISSPGRFIRLWMRGATPSRAPLLRLGFVTQERVTGGVRFRVRYGLLRKNDFNVPLRVAEATLKLKDTEPGEEVRLELPLAAANANETLVLTLERDSRHPDDTVATGVRMLSASLVAVQHG